MTPPGPSDITARPTFSVDLTHLVTAALDAAVVADGDSG